MSKEKRRVPKLRFPGFTEDWEQRKLGDFYTFKNGLNKEKVYFGYGDSIVNFTDVFHNRQIYSSTLKGKVCVNKKELENYKVKEGDLFFTRTSETIDEIGFPAVVMEPMERVVFSGFVLRGRAEKYDPLANIFKSYIFFTDNFRSEMKKKSSMTTRALTSGTALKEMCFSYPKDLEEQTKIGEILLSLDKIITLHQRKLNNLKLKRKALLQKLFPKNGEGYPELRFPGFTDAWEQRKLGDVADVRDGTHDSPKFYNDGFPLVTSKNLKDGSIDFSDCSFISKQDFDEINKRSKVDSGDILFGMIGTIGNPAIVEHTGFAIKNVALIKEGIIVNNRFIYHLLSSKVFDNYIARENAGGTQKFIALNQIRNFIFLAPTLEEQNKIIELLDYISQTITLHQRKLKHLQIQKKSLLQKLFV